MSILQIIERIAATSSKNGKVAILTEESDNLILKQVLVACYDPTINYWIKKIPVTSDNLIACDTIPSALRSLELITSRKVTGHAALKQLQLILESLTDDDAEIIRRVVLRDMKAGFSASTINKVWKGLIKETAYMRCLSGDWLIECDDGMTRTIQDIVDTQYMGKVKSYNKESSTYEFNSIDDWFDNGMSEEWVIIEYIENGERKTSSYLTPDHMLAKNDGEFVKCSELVVGDCLI